MRTIAVAYSGRPRRRGVIFITALGVTVILGGLLLVFAQEMRMELLAAANRRSAVQADAIEQAAEHWVLALVDAYPGDALTITQTPAEALPVGDGYFWILQPNPLDAQSWQYGVSDESAKLNLNTATDDQLMALPAMTQEAADSIVAWRGGVMSPSAGSTMSGADSTYYQTLPEPYASKGAPFESVGELMLVKGVTDQLLHGYDLNHNGVLDPWESEAGGTGSLFNTAGDDGRGFADYVTIYTLEPNTSIDGVPRINVNSRDTSRLRDALRKVLTTTRADEIMVRIDAAVSAGKGGRPFEDMGVFYTTSGMTPDEFQLIDDQLTATSAKTLKGMINVDTAPRQVLMCLPGLESADADALIAQRGGSNATGLGWVYGALPAGKVSRIAGSITARSFQYSADIVAVSGDGRAFKRVRIVVDATQTPARIVFRKDVTALGWPLPADVRSQLRTGGQVVTRMSGFGMF